MNRVAAFAAAFFCLCTSPVFAQDAMTYGLKHLSIVAEDDRVRVVRFAPHKGDKTPMHSHPEMVVYIVKGGKVKFTLPDGSTNVTVFKTGQVILRAPVTHADEALDDVEAILVELKK
jgi:quercetin dioxygenase-like cupin family protein